MFYICFKLEEPGKPQQSWAKTSILLTNLGAGSLSDNKIDRPLAQLIKRKEDMSKLTESEINIKIIQYTPKKLRIL